MVLGADTKKFRTQDSIKLLNYSLNNFTYININEIIENEFNKWIENNNEYFDVYKGISNNLSLSCPKLKYNKIPVKVEDKNKIKIRINCNSNLVAPVFENEKVGTLSMLIDDTVMYSFDICNKNFIEKKGIDDYLKIFFKNFDMYINFIDIF